jgi:FMN phosphatase YigB (HAD superfamily)
MTVAVRDISGFVFDFDGVFYSLQQIKNLYSTCDHLMAETAIELLGNNISYDVAVKLAEQGYKEDGSNIPAFCRWAIKEGHDPINFRYQLFRTFNERYREFLLTDYPHLFRNRNDLKQAFRLSHGKIVNGVATHGHADVLAKYLFQTMGIIDYFHMHAVHGLDEADYTLKHLDPRLVELSFQNLGVDPSKGCFVEDTARNLKAMKERNPKTRCILIHHGQPLEQQPAYIDDQFIDIPEMKRAYYERGLSERRIVFVPR